MPPPGRPAQDFTWNGRGNNGVTWPDGSYTISISATGANGQPGRRLDTGARRYQRRRCQPDPPRLTLGGQKVPISQIQSISR
jgi:flagellar basal-body rod modification protein FlgD